MEIISFPTPCINAKSSFVYTNNVDPTHIYRHNLDKFELWEIKQDLTLVCELNSHDISENIQFQYAHYFHVNDTLLFLIATQTTDGLETFLSIFDPLNCQSTLNRLLFSKKLKGVISNIFISKKLKTKCKKEYHLMTIGTLDSALYVFRFVESDILTQKEPIACTLARTDARNALTHEIIALTNVYVICGGSNGAIDFFLIKDESDFSVAPILVYQRPDFLELPSKLPIVSLECLKNLDKDQILLAVGQELFKPIRISRTIEPSMSLLKINIKDMICKDMMSTKFSAGTHLIPLRPNNDLYTLWTCFPDTEELRITETALSKDKVVSMSNTFFTLPPKDIQQLYIKDENTFWMLDKDTYIKLSAKKTVNTKRQRTE